MQLTTDMLIERVSELLHLEGANIHAVCAETGLSFNTVRNVKLRRGNPTIQTLEKIERYLASRQPHVKCANCAHYNQSADNLEPSAICEIWGRGIERDDDSCQLHERLPYD